MDLIFAEIETRSMLRILNKLNTEAEPSHSHSIKIFNACVRIEFNAAIERELFLRRPAQIIKRRRTVNHDSVQHVSQLPSAPLRRRRLISVDTIPKRYISPIDLSQAIDNLRKTYGE